MRKIINNKMYDTDKAECLAEWDNGRRDDRLYVVIEELYRKRTGEFFLCGFGGPATHYAVHYGNSNWTGSSKIVPLSYEAARKWAEEKLDASEYEHIFGEIAEDDSRASLTVSISAAALARAKREAAKAGTSLSAYIESLIG